MEQEAAFMAVLEATEGYIAAQKELGVDLKKGWWDLAQAKYATSAETMNRLRYDNRLKAAVHLLTIQTMHTSPPKAALFQLKEDDGDNATASFNPLSSFGVLLPAAIREAQGAFNTAIAKVVKLANAAAVLRDALEAWQDAELALTDDDACSVDSELPSRVLAQVCQ